MSFYEGKNEARLAGLGVGVGLSLRSLGLAGAAPPPSLGLSHQPSWLIGRGSNYTRHTPHTEEISDSES